MKVENKMNYDFKRFQEVMPYHAEDDIMLLKGHLLIEELLSEIISFEASTKKNPLGINVEKITFSQKLNLCWAFHSDSLANDFWVILKKVNSLRNSMAHSLTPKNFDINVKKLIDLVFASKEVKEHLDNMIQNSKFTMDIYKGRELYFAISWICTTLSTKTHYKVKGL